MDLGYCVNKLWPNMYWAMASWKKVEDDDDEEEYDDADDDYDDDDNKSNVLFLCAVLQTGAHSPLQSQKPKHCQNKHPSQ